MQSCMAARGFKVIVVDESHTLRTTSNAPDSRHTEAVVAACKRTQRAVLLSGTPSLSRPFDLFRQVTSAQTLFKLFWILMCSFFLLLALPANCSVCCSENEAHVYSADSLASVPLTFVAAPK